MGKPAVILDSNKEEITKLKRKWTTVKNIGDGILAFGTAGLVGSILSPFDFEGPVVEIVTGALAVGGFTLKKIGENRLAEIEGSSATWSEDNKEQLNQIKNNIEETTKKRKEEGKKKMIS